MFSIETITLIILCHLIGDYVLQSNFIASTKGENWYHLFVHSALYIVPFFICFGFGLKLLILFMSHMIIDPLKARYNIISYSTDQVSHYVIGVALYGLGS